MGTAMNAKFCRERPKAIARKDTNRLCSCVDDRLSICRLGPDSYVRNASLGGGPPITRDSEADMQGGDDIDEPNGGGSTPDSAALYIASLTDELAKLARHHGFDTLSYILEMARIEADQVAKG